MKHLGRAMDVVGGIVGFGQMIINMFDDGTFELPDDFRDTAQLLNIVKKEIDEAAELLEKEEKLMDDREWYIYYGKLVCSTILAGNIFMILVWICKYKSL